jgi:hypothetical protein
VERVDFSGTHKLWLMYTCTHTDIHIYIYRVYAPCFFEVLVRSSAWAFAVNQTCLSDLLALSMKTPEAWTSFGQWFSKDVGFGHWALYIWSIPQRPSTSFRWHRLTGPIRLSESPVPSFHSRCCFRRWRAKRLLCLRRNPGNACELCSIKATTRVWWTQTLQDL